MKKGFSLIELLVVIAILAILSSLLAAGITGAIGNGQAGACTSTLRQLASPTDCMPRTEMTTSYLRPTTLWEATSTVGTVYGKVEDCLSMRAAGRWSHTLKMLPNPGLAPR